MVIILSAKLLVDFPDFSYSNEPALTIYFPNCNMKCKWCNFKKMLQIKNLKKMKVEKVLDLLEEQIDFYDIVIISGGEPLFSINEDITTQIIEKVDLIYELYGLNKKIYLFTNFLTNQYSENYYIKHCDKIFVDVKGFTPEEIMNNVNIPNFEAEYLCKKYWLLKDYEKIIFRINNLLNKQNEIPFKNKEYYDVEVI